MITTYSKRRLAIVGAGGHGKVCAYVANEQNNQLNAFGAKWSKIVFIDDNKSGKVNDFEIINKNDRNFHPGNYEVFVAIGDNKTRKELIVKYKELGFKIQTLKHPNTIIGNNTKVGQGTVIMAGVIVNPNTTIGDGVILNTASVIEHDCVISDFVHVSPSVVIAGNVLVDELSWIGANSTVIQNKTIGKNTIVGAGSVVTNDIKDNLIVVGSPAKTKIIL